jgi:membrane protein
VSIARRFARQFVDAFLRNDVLDLAAQVAYFAILALFPFAMFVLTLMGYIPLRGLEGQVLDVLYEVVPPDAGRLVEQTLDEIVGKQRGWLLVSTLLFALWTASGAIRGLTTALNRAYEVAETRPLWRIQLRALVATLASVVASIVATVSMLIGPDLLRRAWSFFHLSGEFDRLWAALRWPLSIFAMTSILAFMYYFLPNVRQRRRHIVPGSIVAVLGWLVAAFGFRLYVAHFAAYARTYGALGTVVVLLLWLYISALMVIVGGQINALLDRLRSRLVHVEKRPRPQRQRGPFFLTDSNPRPA